MKAKNIIINGIMVAVLLGAAGTAAYAQDHAPTPPATGDRAMPGRHARAVSPEELQGKMQKWEERVQSDRIAFLSTEMDLTPEEAQKFWPVYNQAAKERQLAFRRSADALKALRQAVDEGKPEKEIQARIKDYVDAVESSQTINHTEEYLKVLPASKVARLYLAEERFRHRQIRCLGEGGKGGSFMMETNGKPGCGQAGPDASGNKKQRKAK